MISNKSPLYLQIKNKIIKDIFNGVYLEDEALPSVRQMALVLKTNPNTIQKAYRELEQEGYINSIVGKGSFINSQEIIKDIKKNFLQEKLLTVYQELRANGFSHSTIVDFLDLNQKNK